MSETAPDVPAAFAVSPEYPAVMLCGPTASALVVKAAAPDDSATEPRSSVPSKNVTVPVGVPPAPATPAVSVTGLPAVLDAVNRREGANAAQQRDAERRLPGAEHGATQNGLAVLEADGASGDRATSGDCCGESYRTAGAGVGAGRKAGRAGRQGAAWEAERGHPSVPVEGAAGGDVLICVPEGAVVHRVDRHRRVVTPAVEAKALDAGPVDNDRLALGQRPQGVTGEPAGHRDARCQTGPRQAVTRGQVAARVHRHRAHPPVVGVGGERALLIERGGAAGIPDLIPASAARVVAALSGIHAVADHQRLVVAEVAIREPVHEPVAERGERLAL